MDELGKTGFGSHIIRQDQPTASSVLEADHGVRCLAIVAAFIEAGTLRTVKDDYAQPRVQVLPLFVHRR